ncbi:MAG: zinc dependent phospholipase C family protein [Defluviitaleaceae bacterium]|nr:zinc dependent phospholipase C family protein [Defluviitaleaceae bacterium]
MPGFLTHYIAGKAALQGVSPQIQEIINADERLYNLGTQGPDIFFYYLPGQLRKRSRGIAQQMHLSGLGLFLAYMAKLAKEAETPERETIFAYTAGFMLHYSLDCNAHPYVYAVTHNENATKIKNSAKHRQLETAIDVAMLNMVSGKKPAGISQWELINAEKCGLSGAAEALSQSVAAIYNRDVPPKIVTRAMKYTINFTRILQSKNGRRKRFMQLVENMTIREHLFSSMIHMQELSNENDYLNIKKAPWHSPWESEGETHNDSFMERYNLAVDEGIQMLEALHSYVYGDLPIEKLAEILGNRSLKTGLPCDCEKCTA